MSGAQRATPWTWSPHRCGSGSPGLIGMLLRLSTHTIAARAATWSGQPIASFGAVKHKLAEMVIREYAVEAMLYRTAGLIDAAVGGSHDSQAVLAALEEFAIEASILKVASSEMIDFVVDENVQIHGGNGFVHDYPAEMQYRDARVNRIFVTPPVKLQMCADAGRDRAWLRKIRPWWNHHDHFHVRLNCPAGAVVEGVLAFLSERGYPDARAVHSAEESLIFALPPELRRDLRAAQKA